MPVLTATTPPAGISGIRVPAVTAQALALQPPQVRQRFLSSLSPAEAQALNYNWGFWARPNQIYPCREWRRGNGEIGDGEWQTWLVLAGRGFGKTRTGAETVRDWAYNWRAWAPRKSQARIALVGATAADVRDVMVEGESGLLAICPPSFRPIYEPGKRRITFPNGVIATTYTAEQPNRLRGPQHGKAWCDEVAAWRRPEAWDQLAFGLRLGLSPQVVTTTTPRPTPLIKKLIADPTTAVTRGSTYDNRANLAPTFLSKIVRKYEGTRLGRQELLAEILDDNPYALWQRGQIEALRVSPDDLPSILPTLSRIVVAVDPQIADPDALEELLSSDADNDLAETGIVVVGITATHNPKLYVLDDISVSGSPATWAGAAVDAYLKWKADRIVAEANNGGALVEFTVRTVARDRGISVSYSAVHASRGKYTRAEPVAALYEQSRVHHVGCFPELEDQMCDWIPGMKSPDRMDALVWACSELGLAETSWATDEQLQKWMLERYGGKS